MGEGHQNQRAKGEGHQGWRGGGRGRGRSGVRGGNAARQFVKTYKVHPSLPILLSNLRLQLQCIATMYLSDFQKKLCAGIHLKTLFAGKSSNECLRNMCCWRDDRNHVAWLLLLKTPQKHCRKPAACQDRHEHTTQACKICFFFFFFFFFFCGRCMACLTFKTRQS